MASTYLSCWDLEKLGVWTTRACCTSCHDDQDEGYDSYCCSTWHGYEVEGCCSMAIYFGPIRPEDPVPPIPADFDKRLKKLRD